MKADVNKYFTARETIIRKVYKEGRATYGDLMRLLGNKLMLDDDKIGWVKGELTHCNCVVTPTHHGFIFKFPTPRRFT